MTDIVTHLLKYQQTDEVLVSRQALHEAAAEIERLRKMILIEQARNRVLANENRRLRGKK